MKNFFILKSQFNRSTIRLAVFSIVALILVAARSTDELYLASPSGVPAWAEQGMFRFIRIDGGRIEAMKAERTWWGKEFSADEKDVLANVYGRDFDRMLDLLKQARFNWIWVTWSNGWSLAEETENRDQIARVIERCHANNIHVTAYMSATNMFWRSTYADDPFTKKAGLWMYGLPIFYAGANKNIVQVNWQRRLADMRKPEWRAYLVHKAELAIDAGVDAIMFDNIIGDTEGAKWLISDVQRMAAAKAAASGRPKAMVYANVHLTPYRFEINDSCDLVWDEPGKDNPGVYDGRLQVGNARKIKFLRGEKQPWQPLKYENDVYHCGPRERCIPTPAEQKLSIAETYAFGAAYSRNIEGRFLNNLIRGEQDAKDAWAAIAQYNGFIADHPELYHRVVPAARIALLADSERDLPAETFIKANVIFETKVWKHLAKGSPLTDFKVLIAPMSLSRMSSQQKQILEAFRVAGGKILAPTGADLAHLKAGQPAPEFLARVQQAAGGPRLTLDNSGNVIANVTRQESGAFIVHLINYDHDAPAQGVKVTLDMSDVVKGSSLEVKVFSPDQLALLPDNINQRSGLVSFTLERIELYCVAVVTVR
jgi:hypothetical protein